MTIAAFTNYLPLLGGVLPELLANDAHRLVAPAPWPLKVPVLRLPGPGGAVARGAWQQPGRLRLRHQALHLGVRAVAEAGHLAPHQRPIRLDELLEDEHVLVEIRNVVRNIELQRISLYRIGYLPSSSGGED